MFLIVCCIPTESQNVVGVRVDEDVVLPAGDAGGERQLGGGDAAAALARRARARPDAQHHRLTTASRAPPVRPAPAGTPATRACRHAHVGPQTAPNELS